MRIDQKQLDASVEAGIISPDQAEALKSQAAENPAQGEEPLNIVNNFGDVFIVIGLVMMFSAARGFTAFSSSSSVLWVYGWFAVAYWVLAEIFMKGKPRRLALTVAAFLFAYMLFLMAGAQFGEVSVWTAFTSRTTLAPWAVFFAALAVAYIRFKPPILVLALALTGTILVFQAVRIYWADAPALWVLGGCGVAILITGIILDTRDTSRSSGWNDAALWLFIVGSPLTIHPLFLTFFWDKAGDYDNLNWTVFMVAGLALMISLLGVILDRRSLVASSLVYLSLSLGYGLFQQTTSVSLVAGLVPLIIGLGVILLGVSWHPLRRTVLKIVPLGPFRAYLPKYE